MTGTVIAVALLATLFYLLLRHTPPRRRQPAFWPSWLTDVEIITDPMVPPGTMYLFPKSLLDPGWLHQDTIRLTDDSAWEREREAWWRTIPLRPEDVAHIVIANPHS